MDGHLHVSFVLAQMRDLLDRRVKDVAIKELISVRVGK
jgi:hypothetical protein